jgi:hypothetical protein
MVWTVGDVQSINVQGRQSATYGFNIQNELSTPVFAFGYATREEAEAAKAAVEPLVQNAVFLADSPGRYQFCAP